MHAATDRLPDHHRPELAHPEPARRRHPGRSTASSRPTSPTLQKNTAVDRDQDADDRLPGPDAQHREQERPAEAVLERRHAAREVAVPAQAFDLALDRTAINKVVFNGLNLPDCYPISPVSPWYVTTKGLQCNLKANKALAQKLVKASGIPTPIKVTLMHRHRSGRRPARPGDPGDGEGGRLQRRAQADRVRLLAEPRPTRASSTRFAVGWSGRVDPDGNIYGFVSTPGHAERRRLLEPEARLHPEQRPQVGHPEVPDHAVLGRDEDHPPRSGRSSTSTTPSTTTGSRRRSTGVKVYGDGLIRASVRRVRHVGEARRATIMGGFLLRKGRSRPDRPVPREHARLRRRARAAGRSGDSRSAARTATRRCSRRSGTSTGSTSRCPSSTSRGSWLVAAGRPRRRLSAQLPVGAHDRRRGCRSRSSSRCLAILFGIRDRDPRGGDRGGPAREGVATTPRRRSRSSGSRCRTSGSGCC